MVYGHLFFSSPYDQDINKYSIYVHLQSEWNSYPANILFDVTDVWSNPNPKSTIGVFYDKLEPDEFSDYNSNELQFQNDKSYVKLNHEFSNCESSWKPPLYRYAIDVIRNNIEFSQGKQLSDDPYVSKFPNVINDKYNSEQQSDIQKNGYAQFIPICTSKDTTSYEFAISVNDKDIGFDVFFVPSEDELDKFLLEKSFDYYKKPGCYATNYQSFSGKCENVGANSGLLVIVPDDLSLSMTDVQISLHEEL